MNKRSHVDLEITYRDGRPRLAYLHLSDSSEKSAHSRRVSPGMVIDLNKDEQIIGIELLDPSCVVLKDINELLQEYGQEPLKESDVSPLVAA